MDLSPGTLLADRFRIEGPPLGAGESGVVYPAIDEATGRRVAAKLLHEDLVGSADVPKETLLARLQEEAALAGRLRHPRVVEVLGVWAHRGLLPGEPRWVLASERKDAVALTAVGRLTPEAVVALGLDLCEGLAAAHAASLLHGDVRPGNVLIGADGASLFDFALAERTCSRALLRAGESAPERHDGAPPTAASDMYGLGIVLWYALHGELPFSGPTPWAVIGAQRDIDTVRRALAERVPVGLSAWLASRDPSGRRALVLLSARLLHPDPVERPDLPSVRRALTSLRKDPSRLRLPPKPPRFQPRSAWVVHGLDPGTGARALVAKDLSRRRADRLVAHLRREGWVVRKSRAAFELRDLLFMIGGAVASSLLLTPLALPFGLLAARQWRASSVRPSLLTALPPVSVPLPPRRAAAGVESAVVGGLLLLATAASLAWWPPLALVFGSLLVLLAISSVRSRPDEGTLARDGRVEAAFVEIRTLLSAREIDLDRSLSIEGELQALERQWKGDKIATDPILAALERLTSDVRAAPAKSSEARQDRMLDALRRSAGQRMAQGER